MNLTPPSLATLTALAIACIVAACSKTGDAPAASTPVPAQPAVADAALAGKLCAALRRVEPTLKGMPEVGARAQLVMAVAGAFDSDAKALSIVSSEIDAIAASNCVEVRAPLLAVTRAASLQEAVR